MPLRAQQRTLESSTISGGAVDDDELQRWIDEWSAQYPSAYDDSLAALEGIESLGHDDAEALYRWKFRGLWPKRKIKQMRESPEMLLCLVKR